VSSCGGSPRDAGLTSPELANLIAHVKLSLKVDLLASDAFATTLRRYFPEPLRERFAAAIGRHGLRREIVATVIVNEMVDFGGLTSAFRLPRTRWRQPRTPRGRSSS
jgi:glutamate dehydrogenase